MTFLTSTCFSLSVVGGGLIGWVRFRKTDPAFFPFIYLVWLGSLNEVISAALIFSGYPNVISYNFFILGEAILTCWQFYRWQLFGNKKGLYYFFQCFFIGTWITEWMIRPFYSFSSYFIISYSFVLVLMSISTINQLVFKETTSLLKSPVFLICISFVLYFTISVLVETFWVFGLQQSREFRLKVQNLLSYINLLTNIAFTVAILWMPMRQRYILQS
jgi:hypothetical protein